MTPPHNEPRDARDGPIVHAMIEKLLQCPRPIFQRLFPCLCRQYFPNAPVKHYVGRGTHLPSHWNSTNGQGACTRSSPDPPQQIERLFF